MSIESQLGEGTAVTVRMPVLTKVATGQGEPELAGAGAPILGSDVLDPAGGAQVIPFKPQR
jgi:hypothetical protein